MPANLPMKAKLKLEEAALARSPEEKIRLLREFLALCPKHKGTEKLIAHVKKQIARLRREIEEAKLAKRRIHRTKIFVEKEGAAQVVLLGVPNSGKSSFLASITNAKPKVSPYPFTTVKPEVGMFRFEDVYFQIVEAPAIIEGSSKGAGEGLVSLTLARNADVLALVVDVQNSPLKQLFTLVKELREAGVYPARKTKGWVKLEKLPPGAGVHLVVMGELKGVSVNEAEKVLIEEGVEDVRVKVYGELTLDELKAMVTENAVYKPTLIVANKCDENDHLNVAERIREAVKGELDVIPWSCIKKPNDEQLRKLGYTVFKLANIIRVYTREPGEEPSREPLVLEKGAKLEDLLRRIHSEFTRRFKYAKVWSRRFKVNPKKVSSLDLELDDGDVVEVHVR